jgi:hypothetical protein
MQNLTPNLTTKIGAKNELLFNKPASKPYLKHLGIEVELSMTISSKNNL